MILPLNTLEWTRLVLLLETPDGATPESLLATESPNLRIEVGERLARRQDMFLSKYHKHQEVTAFEVEAPTKRRKVGRRAQAKAQASTQGQEAREDNVKGQPSKDEGHRQLPQARH